LPIKYSMIFPVNNNLPLCFCSPFRFVLSMHCAGRHGKTESLASFEKPQSRIRTSVGLPVCPGRRGQIEMRAELNWFSKCRAERLKRSSTTPRLTGSIQYIQVRNSVGFPVSGADWAAWWVDTSPLNWVLSSFINFQNAIIVRLLKPVTKPPCVC